MYWIDWDINVKIERVILGGNFRVFIVNSSLVWFNGFVLDIEEDFFYWVDVSLYVFLVIRVGVEEFFLFLKKKDLRNVIKI